MGPKTRNAGPGGDNMLLALTADADMSALPEEIQLIPAGRHETDKGPFTLDEAAAAEVMKDASGRANDFVIDYEHQTLKDMQAPAAGWITRLINKGADGIWGAVAWTAKAQEYLKNREYRYLSPVFLKSKADGRVVRFLMAGLTNAPAIDGMNPVVHKTGIAVTGGEAAAQEEENNMEQILQALGLDPAATVDVAVSAIEALKSKTAQAACKSVLALLGLKDGAGESEVTGTIMAMKSGSSETAKLAQQVSELSGKLAERDATDLVAAAMKDGKISPAQKDWAHSYAKRDPEGFKFFAAKAPVIVPLGEHKPGQAPQPKEGELTETEQTVCKQLGVSKEDYFKANPQEAKS